MAVLPAQLSTTRIALKNSRTGQILADFGWAAGIRVNGRVLCSRPCWQWGHASA
jgi:hypothetical protein